MNNPGDQEYKLSNLQPLGGLQPAGVIPVIQADKADDAPC